MNASVLNRRRSVRSGVPVRAAKEPAKAEPKEPEPEAREDEKA